MAITTIRSNRSSPADGDVVIVSATMIVTLPAPVAAVRVIVKIPASSVGVAATVQPPAGALLEGSAVGLALTDPGALLDVIADGTNYHVIGRR